MVVLDLLGRRTTLRILWELQSGSLTFRALLDACETNTRLLNIRLGELREVGLVDHAEGGTGSRKKAGSWEVPSNPDAVG
jgi:DNA-binding HxlR family transcriptional regulator